MIKKVIKTISITLSILMVWQALVWADPDIFRGETLQPRLLFSSPKPEDAFFHMVSGYLGFYLTDIENNPDMGNIPRLKAAIDEKLKTLKASDNIPAEFRGKLPESAEYDAETASIIIDLGESKVRYFDHNVPGSAVRSRTGADTEYDITEKKIGRYLTRQVIRKKSLPGPTPERIVPETNETAGRMNDPVLKGLPRTARAAKGAFKYIKSLMTKTADHIRGYLTRVSLRMQQADEEKGLDIVSGLFELHSVTVRQLEQKKSMGDNTPIIVVVTGKRCVGKTTIAAEIGKGFAGIPEKEILVAEHDRIDELSTGSFDRSYIFNKIVEETSPGKKLIILEGLRAADVFRDNDRIKKADILVILNPSENVRKERFYRKLGEMDKRAKHVFYQVDGGEEPEGIDAGCRIVIANDDDMGDLDSSVFEELRSGKLRGARSGELEVAGSSLEESSGSVQERPEPVSNETLDRPAGKQKGDILHGFDAVQSDFVTVVPGTEERTAIRFTRGEFQARREKEEGKDSFSYTTCKTELEGMVKLGILEVERTREYRYFLTDGYLRASPGKISDTRLILSKLPASPDDLQLGSAKRLLDGEVAVKELSKIEIFSLEKRIGLLSYYFRQLAKLNHGLIRLYTERRALEGDLSVRPDTETRDKLSTCLQTIEMYEDILNEELDLFISEENDLIDITFGRDYKKDIGEKIQNAVKNISGARKNEPAACVSLNAAWKLVEQELGLLRKARRAKASGGMKSVWVDREKRIVSVWHGQYEKRKLPGGREVNIKVRKERKTGLLWQALRAEDHTVDGILTERDDIMALEKETDGFIGLLETEKHLKDKDPGRYARKTAFSDKEKKDLGKLLVKIAGKTGKKIVEEKDIVASDARHALDLAEMGEYESVLELLRVINSFLKIRRLDLEEQIVNITGGRLVALREEARWRNSFILKRLKAIEDDIGANQVRKAVGSARHLYKWIWGRSLDKKTGASERYKGEPEFARMDEVVRLATIKLQEGDKARSRIYLGFFAERVKLMALLDHFMEDMRDSYVAARLDGAGEGCYEKIFEEKYRQYLEFAHKNNIGRGSPRLIRTLFYFAAHNISMEIKDPASPSQKITSPLFKAFIDLVRMFEINDIQKLERSLRYWGDSYKRTLFLIEKFGKSGHRFLDRMGQSSYGQLVYALAGDLQLKGKDRLIISDVMGYSLHEQFKDAFRGKKPFSWKHKNKRIEATLCFDNIFGDTYGSFAVEPDESFKKKHPELLVMDKPMRSLMVNGFGAVLVDFTSEKGKSAIRFRDILFSPHFMALGGKWITVYSAWAGEAVGAMSSVAESLGLEVIVSEKVREILGRYKEQEQQMLPGFEGPEKDDSGGRWPFLRGLYDRIGSGWVGQALSPAVIESVVFVGGMTLLLSWVFGINFSMSPPFLGIATAMQLAWHLLHGKSVVFTGDRISISIGTVFTALFLELLGLPDFASLSVALFLPHFTLNYLRNKQALDREKKGKEDIEKEEALNGEIAVLIKRSAENGVKINLAGMSMEKLAERGDIIKDLEAYCVVKDKKTLKYLLERRLGGKDRRVFDAVFNPREMLLQRKEEGKDPLKVVHIRGGRGSAAITEEITKMAEENLVDLTIIPGAVDDGRSFADMALYFNATGVPDMGKCHCNMGKGEVKKFAEMRLIDKYETPEGKVSDEEARKQFTEREAIRLMKDLVIILKKEKGIPEDGRPCEVEQLKRLFSGFADIADNPAKQRDIISFLEAFINMVEFELNYKGNVINIKEMPMRSLIIIGARTKYATWQETINAFGKLVGSSGRVLLPTEERLHAMALLEDGTFLPTENAINELTGKAEYHYFTVGPRSFADELMFDLLFLASGKSGIAPTEKQKEAVEALRTRDVKHLDENPEKYRIRLFDPRKHKKIMEEFLDYIDEYHSYQSATSGIEIYPEAIEAIAGADAILYGPTDIESNIASAVIYGEISEAIKNNAEAAKILIANSADNRGVEPEGTTTVSQLERLYRYMSGQQRYKVSVLDTGMWPTHDYVTYVVGRGSYFMAPPRAIRFDEKDLKNMGTTPVGQDLEMTRLGYDVHRGLFGAEYRKTPAKNIGEYNPSVTVDTIISLGLLKAEGVSLDSLAWEAEGKGSGRKIDLERSDKIRKIVDHYADAKNMTMAEKRYTPQGHFYAPSSSKVLVKLAQEFIAGRDTKVLDMGYGAGKAAAVFSLFAGSVTGVELDSAGLAEAGEGHIDKLAKDGIIDKNKIRLVPEDFLGPELDLSEFDLVYIFWPYKTEESEKYAREIAEKLSHPEKGLKKGAIFAVNAPAGEAFRVFISEFERVDIKYENWEEEKTLGGVVFTFRKKETGDGMPATRTNPVDEPYISDEARDLLEVWKKVHGTDNTSLIDIYYGEDELKTQVEEAGLTPQGAIHSGSEIADLISIGEKLLKGRNAKVLDAGAGSGKAVAVFSQYASHVTGVEIDSRSRSAEKEDRLFEVGQKRIQFLEREGIVDRDKVTLIDDDFLSPEFDLSGYDVIYHYWAFKKEVSGEYMEKFREKLLDPVKGLKPGGIFILNSMVRGVVFPDLETMDVHLGNNITVYRRSLDEKRGVLRPEELSDEKALFGALSGARIYGKEGRGYELIRAKDERLIRFIDEKGVQAGQVKLSCSDEPVAGGIYIDELEIYPDHRDKDVDKGFLRLLGKVVPEGTIVYASLKERETVGYLEKLSDNGRNVTEQKILKGYNPSACRMGSIYSDAGFTTQLVRIVGHGKLQEYELVAFMSNEPYSYKKAKNMFFTRIFAKYGDKDSYVERDGYVRSISRFTSPAEKRMRSCMYKEIIKGIPGRSGILSVGVGTGVFEEDFVKAGYEVTGVDVTPAVLARAAKRGIRTIEADAEEASFWGGMKKEEKYSAVIFTESLEYFDDPENMFRMTKEVLAETGKIYVLARNIPGNRREELYEKALKRAGFLISDGSGALFGGKNIGMRMIVGELPGGDHLEKEMIVEKAKGVIPRLVHHMMFLAQRNPGAKEESEKEKKTVLLIDKELSRMNGNADIVKGMKTLISLLAGIKRNNKELSELLESLEIIEVEGSRISENERFKEYKNIIAVTRASNKSRFEHINSNIVVAAIQDKDFPKDAYLPLLEITLFAIGKYLKLEPRVLKEYYEMIPNVKSPQELEEDGELFDIFDPASRSFVIQLPHARNFEASKTLAETMAIIQDLLRKA